MPLREAQVEDHVFSPSDWDAEPARGPIKPVRLVLGLQQEAPDVRDSRRLPLSRASPAGLQRSERNLKGGRDVLLVHQVFRGQGSVRGPHKPGARAQVRPKGDSNRLVDDEPKLGEERDEGRG